MSRTSLHHAADRQRADGLSERTVSERLRVWHHFRTTTNTHPRDAHPDHAELWWETLSRRSPATRATYLSALRSYYKTTGLPDPTTDLRRPRMPHYMPRPLSDRQLAQAFRIGGDVGVWIHLAGMLGLRCVEIAALTPDSVTEDGLLRVDGKGDRVRFLPITGEVGRVLAGYGWPRVSAKAVSRMVGRALRKAGVDATAHQLRHTAATRFLRSSGYDLAATSRLLGHASVATTMVYAATDVRRTAEVLARMDDEVA